MKRAILLLLFLMMFINVSHAQENQRWLNVYKDDAGEFFLDKETVTIYTYEKNAYIGCWLRLKFNDKSLVQRIYFNTETLRYLRERCLVYDKKGTIVEEDNYSKNGWVDSIPESKMEYALKSTAVVVVNNLDKWDIKADTKRPHE